MNAVVNSSTVAMLVSATGRPESERSCVASFRAGRRTIKRETQCTRPLPNCSLPPSPQCLATTPFLPLSTRGTTGGAPNARDASGYSDPPPKLGVDALEAVRSGETRQECGCVSAVALAAVWYVRGCSRVAES